MTYNQQVAANIRAEMARQQKKTRDLEGLLSISTTAARARLNGTVPFSLNDIWMLACMLEIPPSRLVATEAVPRDLAA